MQTAKLLAKVGDEGKYQVLSIIFVGVAWLVVALTVFLPSYLLITPTFTCGEQMGLKEVDACSMQDKCTIDQIQTITSYAGLYCDQNFIRQSILSSYFAGSIAGLVILSIVADKFGRRIVIIGTIAVCTLGSIGKTTPNIVFTLGGYIRQEFLIFLGMLLMGIGGYALNVATYSYLSQVNSDIWRQVSLILVYCFWTFGEVLLYPIITFLKGWLEICIWVFIIPLILLLLCSFLLAESPQFLYAHRRYEECLLALNIIAKFNNRTYLTEIGVIVEHKEEHEKVEAAFFKAKYLIPLIVLSFSQACNNGSYYIVQYSIDDYGYRFQVNMLVIGLLEFISCIIINFFCHRMKRQFWLIVLMVVSGLFSISVQFCDNKLMELMLIGGSRLFNSVGFALFNLLTSQTFPTTIRSTGLGLVEALSNFGNMSAPFLVLLVQFYGVGIKTALVGGLLNMMSGASLLMVQQTKKESKSDELRQSLIFQMLEVNISKLT